MTILVPGNQRRQEEKQRRRQRRTDRHAGGNGAYFLPCSVHTSRDKSMADRTPRSGEFINHLSSNSKSNSNDNSISECLWQV